MIVDRNARNRSNLHVFCCRLDSKGVRGFDQENAEAVENQRYLVDALAGIVRQRQTYAKYQVHVGQCATKIPIITILVRRFVIPRRHWIFIGLAHIHRMKSVLQHHRTHALLP